MNEEQIIELLKRMKHIKPGLRVGQFMFNNVEDMCSKTANRVRGTNSDPYYDSSRIIACLGAITDNTIYHKYKQEFAALL